MDPSSFANLEDIRTFHYDITLLADFDARRLRGHVDISARSLKDGVSHIALDTKSLAITDLTDLSGTPLTHHLHKEEKPFGQKLIVNFAKPLQNNEAITFRIHYWTESNASAIQWLSPEQTKNKKHPFLYTQCQAIHARSLLPCQDSPAAKSTYTAKITIPDALVALMSAITIGKAETSGENKKTYHFEQKIPVPSYLIALAIGDMTHRQIGPRSGIWTENDKDLVNAAASDFSDTEKYISIAEEICGEYIWGKYDILMLPPSFPYGGMENPTLTFVTPALITGDKSNADVVAHEITHSWTGNLVTNLNWEHFWLNEGFTMFVERKIITKLYGKQLAHLSMILGWQDLKDDIVLFEKENPQLTRLVVDLKGVDPDDAFSTVPYEKGFNFLFYLESILGEDNFGVLLKQWLKTYAKLTVTSDDWKNMFLNFAKDKVAPEKLATIDWDKWLYEPGMPPVTPTFDHTLEEACNALAEKWIQEGKNINKADLNGWSPLQIQVFLDKLREVPTALPISVVHDMDKLYDFSSSSNMEISYRFFLIAIKSEYNPILDKVIDFVTSIGRMKYIRPLYRALFASTMGKHLAQQTFTQSKNFYHPIAAHMLAKDLKLDSL